MYRLLVTAILGLALAACGVVMAKQIRKHGVSGVIERVGVKEPASKRATTALMKAAFAMDEYQARKATYIGADIRAHKDVGIAYSSDSTYCLHVAKDGQVFHVNGPRGTPAPGRC